MLALAVAIFLAPVDVPLPAGGMCPDAVLADRKVHIVCGDGRDAFTYRYGSSATPNRVNSMAGTVHAGGERGPKIAAGAGIIHVVWQGDYRKGPAAWYARSTDGGRTFEPQRNLILGETPGVDQVAIAAFGKEVFVCWLDGRGGPDPEAPVTSTIYYVYSTDGGKTFGPNSRVTADQKIRACACCTMSASFSAAEDVVLLFRGGIANVREIWAIRGLPSRNSWDGSRVTNDGWIFEGCPMDGPRLSDSRWAWTSDGSTYVNGPTGGSRRLLGRGKYATVCDSWAAWQEKDYLRWTNLETSQSGSIPCGPNRACMVRDAGGQVLIVH